MSGCGCGMGDYVNFFDCPYPSVLPDAMVPYIVNSQGSGQSRGLGCATGCGCGPGMGAFQMTAPDGYFSSGFDFSQWGFAEWASVLVGVYLVYSAFFTTRAAVGFAREGVKRSRSRRKKIEAAHKARGFL